MANHNMISQNEIILLFEFYFPFWKAHFKCKQNCTKGKC